MAYNPIIYYGYVPAAALASAAFLHYPCSTILVSYKVRLVGMAMMATNKSCLATFAIALHPPELPSCDVAKQGIIHPFLNGGFLKWRYPKKWLV